MSLALSELLNTNLSKLISLYYARLKKNSSLQRLFKVHIFLSNLAYSFILKKCKTLKLRERFENLILASKVLQTSNVLTQNQLRLLALLFII